MILFDGVGERWRHLRIEETEHNHLADFLIERHMGDELVHIVQFRLLARQWSPVLRMPARRRIGALGEAADMARALKVGGRELVQHRCQSYDSQDDSYNDRDLSPTMWLGTCFHTI